MPTMPFKVVERLVFVLLVLLIISYILTQIRESGGGFGANETTVASTTREAQQQEQDNNNNTTRESEAARKGSRYINLNWRRQKETIFKSLRGKDHILHRVSAFDATRTLWSRDSEQVAGRNQIVSATNQKRRIKIIEWQERATVISSDCLVPPPEGPVVVYHHP